MRVRIAHKLFIVLLLVGLVPMAAGVYFFSRQLEANQQATVSEMSRERVSNVANQLADKLQALLVSLSQAARRLTVSDADREVLTWPYGQHPELHRLVVTDPSQRVVAALSRVGFLAKGSRFRPGHMPETESGVSFVFWNLEPQLHIHKPIIDLLSGREIGVMHADLSLKSMFGELTAGVGGERPPYILREDGRVVSHADINLVLNAADFSRQPLISALKTGQRFAQAEYTASDGVPVLGVAARVPGMPLLVVKEVTQEQAYALSRQLLLDTAVVFTLVALLLIIVAVALSRTITRPVELLEQGTRRVERGELDFAIASLKGPFPDEMKQLAERFNLMIEALKHDRQTRHKVELELRRLQHYLHNIIDSMPSLLIGVNAEMRVTHWNRESERVTGWAADRAIGRPLLEVCPQMHDELPRVRQSIATGQPFVDSKVPGKPGSTDWFVDVTIYPLITDGVEGAVIRIDDVSEQVRLEETLIQSEKMLTVGGLAAGMAHEINNPLAGVMQNCQVIRNRLTEEMPRNLQAAQQCGVTMPSIACYLQRREILPMLDMVMASAQRAAKIVSNMLGFSRKSDASMLPVDLHQLLDSTIELAANDYDLKKHYDFRSIEIQRDYDLELPDVPCDKGKIQQVVLNLLKNGAQAMVQNTASMDAPVISIRTGQEDKWAKIEIEDNGPGIEPSIQKRIFEPFFTTKEVGQGTGLGLSVSYFIVRENHGGNLELRSEPGAGSCFTIKLPLHR